MGAVVKAVSSAVSSVVKFVGNAVQSVGKFVGNVVQNALDNPLQTLASVAVIALAPYAAPLIGASVATTTAIGMGLVSATSVVANGGSIGEALKAAALSAGTSWIGASAGAYIGNAAVSAGASQFVGSTVGTVAGRAIAGAGNAAITGRDILEGAGSGALQGLIGSLTGAGIREIGLERTLTGALGTGAAAYATNTIASSLSGGLNALARGDNFSEGASNSALNSITNRLTGAAQDYARSVYNDHIAPVLSSAAEQFDNLRNQGLQIDSSIEQLNGMSTQYNEEYNRAQEIAEQAQTISPEYNAAIEAISPYSNAYDEARTAYDARSESANALFATYQTKLDEYNTLYQQFEAARDSGDDAEAERLAGVITPMGEELQSLDAQVIAERDTLDELGTTLNSATEALNSIVGEHTGVLEEGNRLNEALTNSQSTLQGFQNQATELSEQIQQQREAYDQGMNEYNATNEDLSQRVRSYDAFVEAFSEEDPETAVEYMRRNNPFDISIAAQRGARAEAENPWAASAELGIQRFDDGSSIQFFDDGSSIVTDSEGREFTYNERGQAYNADAGLIGAPEQVGPGQFKQVFDDGSYIITDGSGNPIETYDTEGELYEPGSNPNLPGNRQPRSASSRLPSSSAAGRQNTAVRRTTQTRQGATEAARQEATAQAQRRAGSTSVAASPQEDTTSGYGLSDLFKGTSGGAPLIALKGVSEIEGQQYNSLDPLSPSAQVDKKDANEQRSAHEENPFDPLAGLYNTSDFGGANSNASSFGAGQPGLANLNVDPLSSLYGQHAAGGGVISRGPKLGGAPVYGASHTAVRGGGDGISDSIVAKVKPKSYVLPARVVSEIGNGSSSAGTQKLVKFTHHIGSLGALKHLASGGAVDETPIEARLSQDEFVLPPEVVAHIGGGSQDMGAQKLDALVQGVDRRRKGLQTIADEGGDYLAALI